MGCCSSRVGTGDYSKCKKCPHPPNERKRALVMSGGGSWGSYEVGVLMELIKADPRPFDIISGVSVGALNAGFLSMYPKGHEKEAIDDLHQLWSEIKESDVYKPWCCCKSCSFVFGATCRPAFFDSSPLQKLVKRLIDMEVVRSNDREVRVGVVCLEDGQYREIGQDSDDFPKGIIASSAFPAYLLAEEIEGKHYSDGGVRNIIGPVQNVIDLGAQDIDIVVCSPSSVTAFVGKTGVKIAFRTLEIMTNEVILDDLAFPKPEGVNVRFFVPKSQIGTDPLAFDHGEIMARIAKGRTEAKEIMEKTPGGK